MRRTLSVGFERTLRVAAWMCVLAVAFYSLSPQRLKEAASGEPGTPGQLNHAIAYVITAAAMRVAYPHQAALRVVLWLWFYGTALEGLQHFVPDRVPRLVDALANGLGAAVGAFGAGRYLSFWNRGERAVRPGNG